MTYHVFIGENDQGLVKTALISKDELDHAKHHVEFKSVHQWFLTFWGSVEYRGIVDIDGEAEAYLSGVYVEQ